MRLDPDNFKRLNDHDGHLAERLKRCVPGVGTVARNAHKGKI